MTFSLLDILRTIRDPEKPNTLEDLNVVYEEGVFIQDPTSDNVQVVRLLNELYAELWNVDCLRFILDSRGIQSNRSSLLAGDIDWPLHSDQNRTEYTA